MGAMGACHPHNFGTSPEILMFLEYYWHPQSPFHETVGTHSFKVSTQALQVHSTVTTMKKIFFREAGRRTTRSKKSLCRSPKNRLFEWSFCVKEENYCSVINFSVDFVLSHSYVGSTHVHSNTTAFYTFRSLINKHVSLLIFHPVCFFFNLTNEKKNPPCLLLFFMS